jgi:hypothetical protein
MMENPQNKRSARHSKTFRRKGLLNVLAVAEMKNGTKPGIR